MAAVLRAVTRRTHEEVCLNPEVPRQRLLLDQAAVIFK